jgi:hypothetical protein
MANVSGINMYQSRSRWFIGFMGFIVIIGYFLILLPSAPPLEGKRRGFSSPGTP